MRYEKLLAERPLLASEKPHSYALLTERHLQVLWYEQKYFNPLCTEEGEQITVLSPGIWNSEAGPDFVKAHLKIGNRELRGDVEIHFSDDDWHHHKHDNDLRYEHVVLHVSLWKPKNRKKLTTIKGQTFIQSYFEDVLNVPTVKIVQLIDLDLYPYKQFLGSGQCSKELFQNLSKEKIINFFDTAAKWRLKQKYKYLSFRIQEEQWQAPAGISMALGYRDNAEEFLTIFQTLLPQRTLSENQLMAMAMGISGYFEERYKTKWKDSHYYLLLEAQWHEFAHQMLHQATLKIAKIRPINHPVRRLAYLSKWLCDPFLEKIQVALINLWKSKWKGEAENNGWKSFHLQMQNLIPDYTDSYWNHHYTFEIAPQNNFLNLIGNELKTQIILNTFLPIIYHHICSFGTAAEEVAFEQYYQQIKAPKNSKNVYLTHRFFGESKANQLLDNAKVAQGAYQLHHDFCLRYEASCVGCPFVERYKALQ